jgi:hypothetical protein
VLTNLREVGCSFNSDPLLGGLDFMKEKAGKVRISNLPKVAGYLLEEDPRSCEGFWPAVVLTNLREVA